MISSTDSRAGRPVVTSRAEIEKVAFALFRRDGYEQTTVAKIADELGVGRRTIFRYFTSKHDIAWGSFDRELRRLAVLLREQSESLTVREAVLLAVTQANVTASDVSEMHAARMRFILHEPTLQNHSTLRYGQWREVIADYVADREAMARDDPWPRLVAFATNAVAIAAYTEWLSDPSRPLRDCFERATDLLRDFLA